MDKTHFLFYILPPQNYAAGRVYQSRPFDCLGEWTHSAVQTSHLIFGREASRPQRYSAIFTVGTAPALCIQFNDSPAMGSLFKQYFSYCSSGGTVRNKPLEERRNEWSITPNTNSNAEQLLSLL